MSEIADWIIKVSGIICIGALCDMIMPAGAMKKYVSYAAALILIITVVAPVTRLRISVAPLQTARGESLKASDTVKRLSERQRSGVVELYREKLAENIKNTSGLSEADMVTVEVNEKSGEGFGSITGVRIQLASAVDSSSVADRISEKYGVKQEDIHIADSGD